MTRRTIFVVALSLQLMLLGWMVGTHERSLATGARVVLAVEAFDPIDYLAGRYVNIRLAVSHVDTQKTPLVRGDTAGVPDAAARSMPIYGPVFVELAQDGELWKAARVVVADSGITPRAPFLRGRVTYQDGTTLQVEFELDRFYIPADGHDPSALIRDPKHVVRALVCIPADGGAVFDDLLVDGRSWHDWDAEQRALGK